MPELPEVETIKRALLSLEGERVRSLQVFWPRSAYEKGAFLKSQIENKKILKVSRRAKFLRFHFDLGVLWMHLRMSGKLLFNYQGSYERLRFFFCSGKTLSLVDVRKFARVNFDVGEKMEKRLGLEPLEAAFNQEALAKICKRRRKLKPLLLDQSLLAGLGNIYVDEALWLAKLHPERLGLGLRKRELCVLHGAIIEVLQQGIDNHGCSLGDHPDMNYLSVGRRPGKQQEHLNVFRRQGQFCRRCSSSILKTRVAQRGTHYCPKCQILNPSS